MRLGRSRAGRVGLNAVFAARGSGTSRSDTPQLEVVELVWQSVAAVAHQRAALDQRAP